MGKSKASGSQNKYISVGEVPTINRKLKNAIRRDRTEADRLMDKLDAWEKGQNPWITVENRGEGLREKFTRVRANDYWGNPKNRGFYMGMGKD